MKVEKDYAEMNVAEEKIWEKNIKEIKYFKEKKRKQGGMSGWKRGRKNIVKG